MVVLPFYCVETQTGQDQIYAETRSLLIHVNGTSVLVKGGGEGGGGGARSLGLNFALSAMSVCCGPELKNQP